MASTKTNPTNIFTQSFAHTYRSGSKTYVDVEDLPCADKFDPNELHLFLKYGSSDFNASTKTKDQIEQDSKTILQSIELTDPFELLNGEEKKDSK